MCWEVFFFQSENHYYSFLFLLFWNYSSKTKFQMQFFFLQFEYIYNICFLLISALLYVAWLIFSSRGRECAPVEMAGVLLIGQCGSLRLGQRGRWPSGAGLWVCFHIKRCWGPVGDKLLRYKISLFPPQGWPWDSILDPQEHEADTLPMRYQGILRINWYT